MPLDTLFANPSTQQPRAFTQRQRPPARLTPTCFNTLGKPVNLAFKLSGGNAVVYRKRWGVIAFASFMAVICFGAGAAFYSILLREPKSAIAIPFAGIGLLFALFGLLILRDVLRKAGTWLRDGAVPLVTANRTGLTIAANYSARPQTYPWSSISEIILAKSLDIIESDESKWTNHQFILMLRPQAQPKTIWEQMKAQIAKSGEGKLYLSTDFPPSRALEIERSLRQLAPAAVVIRRTSRVTFNRKTGVDSHEPA